MTFVQDYPTNGTLKTVISYSGFLHKLVIKFDLIFIYFKTIDKHGVH